MYEDKFGENLKCKQKENVSIRITRIIKLFFLKSHTGYKVHRILDTIYNTPNHFRLNQSKPKATFKVTFTKTNYSCNLKNYVSTFINLLRIY